MKKTLILSLVLAVFVACKSDKKEENKNYKEKINLDDSSDNQNKKVEKDNYKSVVISIEAIVTKDDTFHLMYLSDDIKSWSPKGLIKKNIKGEDKSQKIQFRLPPGVFPTKFRIDLGFNKKQKNIDLYKIIIQFEGRELTVEEQTIEKYFIPNKYAKYLEGNKADLNFEVVNNKYNPLIITTDYFIKRLETNLYL